MSVKIILNTQKIQNKVTNDRFGRLVSMEWKRLLDPYTPRDTGILQDTAEIYPWRIRYKGQRASNGKFVAAYVYYNEGANFQKKNPYATYEWDKSAEKAGQKNKLYRAINNARKTGQY